MTKHTPGPWIAEHGDASVVLDAERGRVCTINWLRGPHGSFGRRTDAEGEANAHLISAAPDLLAAVKTLLFEHPVYRGKPIGGEGSPARRSQQNAMVAEDAARSAIAKAENARP